MFKKPHEAITKFFDKISKSTVQSKYRKVNKKYRKQGLGTKMVEEALKFFETLDVPAVWLGCDYGCLYSGLFIDNNEESHKFFLNRGFIFDHNTHNIILRHKIEIKKTLGEGFKYQFLNDDLREKMIAFRKSRSTEMNIPAYYVFTNDRNIWKNTKVQMIVKITNEI